MSSISRREFLVRTGAFSLGLAGLGYAIQRGAQAWAQEDAPGRYGPLVRDGEGIIDLPAGFSYGVLSRAGERMDDGLTVPEAHDGMAAFPGPNGQVILVRNHEMDLRGVGAFGPGQRDLDKVPSARIYDRGTGAIPGLGGTTTLVYDPTSKRLVRHFLSLAGTLRNCAGGPTPWGSWVTCEETTFGPEMGPLQRRHGYAFEVPATAQPALAEPVPLAAMGRFQREAVAVDPRTGMVYQTEDRGDGLLYRFIPDVPGKLAQGGRLQALVISARPGVDTRNRNGSPEIALRKPMAVSWVDLDRPKSPKDDLRVRGHALGAARFTRGEGIAYADGAVHFACTDGGSAGKGQVWTYRPDPQDTLGKPESSAGTLELFCEPNDRTVFENVDNLTVAPWGDLILCEDGPGVQHVVGVTPTGSVYKLARTELSEFAGATFSPDGQTLFVNIQRPGLTLAITGRWEGRAG